MEPKREYLTTFIFLLWRASSAIISSVALPQVALSSPPTAISKFQSLSYSYTLLIHEYVLI